MTSVWEKEDGFTDFAAVLQEDPPEEPDTFGGDDFLHGGKQAQKHGSAPRKGEELHPHAAKKTADAKENRRKEAAEGTADKANAESMENAAAAAQFPKREKRQEQERKAAEGDSHLLFVQVILCALITGFVLFAKSTGAPFLDDLRAGYSRMLTEGVDFSAENSFARFAQSTVHDLRIGVQNLVNTLDAAPESDARGGSWAVTDTKKPPVGATFEKLPLGQKLRLPVQGNVTSGYGFRKNPVTGGQDFHAGVDIAAAEGTPVYAAQDGQVVRAGYNRLRGSFVVIRHEHGVKTLYQHLSYSFVRGGEMIRQGQCIAQVGSTGMVTGPHLHLEVLVDGVCTDPMYAFPQLAQ